MKRRYSVFLVGFMVFAHTFALQAHAQTQGEEAEVIKTFLSEQKTGSEDAQTVASVSADLDGDGKSEIVLLWVMLGPTYWSNKLTVFSKTSTGYKPAASLPLLGNTTKMSIAKGGIIVVDHELLAKNDPRCCPSIKKQLKYRWVGKKISEVKARPK